MLTFPRLNATGQAKQPDLPSLRSLIALPTTSLLVAGHDPALPVRPPCRAMEEGDGAPVRTTSALSAGTAASDAAAVSESLEGLVSAVDELKKSMGLGEQVDFAAVEQYIHRLRHENEEFRQFAEEAILVGAAPRVAGGGWARGGDGGWGRPGAAVCQPARQQAARPLASICC